MNAPLPALLTSDIEAHYLHSTDIPSDQVYRALDIQERAPAGMPGVHEKVRCIVKGGGEDAWPVRASAAAAAACASGTSGHGTAANAAV